MYKKPWRYRISNDIRKKLNVQITTENSLIACDSIIDSLQKFKNKKDIDQYKLEELLDHFDFAKDCLVMPEKELKEEFEMERFEVPGLINDYIREFWDFCDEHRIFVSLE